MASGDELERFGAWDNDPQTGNTATPDTRNTTRVLDFPDTANFFAVFTGHVSSKYSGGSINIKAEVVATSALTGTSDWDFELEKIGTSKDLDVDSYGTLVSVDGTTVPATAGIGQIITASMTGAALDGVVAGDVFRLRITNDSISDTRAGDMELLEVVLVEA